MFTDLAPQLELRSQTAVSELEAGAVVVRGYACLRVTAASI